ncbi:MAG TPA: hypothetical protein VHC98_02265 [Candidatus Saccharimonadales bacterium]|nr:hypothetical protein [Candidatus Saccharimonadales bacterium]
MFDIVAATASLTIVGKGLMLALSFFGVALGIGMIGSNYYQAVGRNPETSKTFGQALVFVAIIELFALLAFAALFIVN